MCSCPKNVYMRLCLYCIVKIGTIHHWQVYCTVVNQIQKLNTNPTEYSYSLKTTISLWTGTECPASEVQMWWFVKQSRPHVHSKRIVGHQWGYQLVYFVSVTHRDKKGPYSKHHELRYVLCGISWEISLSSQISNLPLICWIVWEYLPNLN